jgi:hypothetical protein
MRLLHLYRTLCEEKIGVERVRGDSGGARRPNPDNSLKKHRLSYSLIINVV